MSADIPLVAFINSRSGGQLGAKIIEKLKKYIPAENVFDLTQNGPSPGLLKYKGSRYRILVCGGDGTVGWVLSELEKLKVPQEITPPIAILPLGTGNDLSRTLKWGGGYSGKSLKKFLARVEKACVVLMDRWRVTCEGTGEHPTTQYFMNNYFSVGADADVALQFHEMRNAHPSRFTSRTQNLAWYVRIGLQNLSPELLAPHIEVEIDGNAVRLPEKTRCVVVLNLPSYAGGGNPWGPFKNSHKKRNFTSPAIDDGLLELVAINTPVKIAAIHANVGRGRKLGQGKDIKITLRKQLPTQVDGEPWRQPPCVVTIQYAGKALMLANSLPTSPHPDPIEHPLALPLKREGSVNPVSRTRSSSTPIQIQHTPSPIRYGPTPPSKRKKNRVYCDSCGLEFYLPHMLTSHLANGSCSASSSSSSEGNKGESSTRVSMQVTAESSLHDSTERGDEAKEEWHTQSVGSLISESSDEEDEEDGAGSPNHAHHEEPVEQTEPTEPEEPPEAIESTEPTESIEPIEPIEPGNHAESVEPTETTEPEESGTKLPHTPESATAHEGQGALHQGQVVAENHEVDTTPSPFEDASKSNETQVEVSCS